ncbi:thiamine-phosphate kinase [Ornithinimicrobium sp. Y1847]|uniref:thiamine-phosphate kinase n=1 Tax=unclassified Ornithinimicrobium TaxID=2615080 RepID=UPI003B67812B
MHESDHPAGAPRGSKNHLSTGVVHAQRGADGRTLGGSGEDGVLREVFATLAGLPDDGVLVGPGDDAALLRLSEGTAGVLTTTDTMVRDRDWRDDWSSAQDVGIKIVTQNLADLAAMGGVGTGLLVTLVADPDLPLRWARDLTAGIAEGAGLAGVPVIGGDLSSAAAGVVMVSVTALGELGDGVAAPVLRSGARAGEVLAVSGALGRSGTGWRLLEQGVLAADEPAARSALEHHRRPLTDLGQGPIAARVGASAMIDVSDGLVRDGDRIARASRVRLDLLPYAVEHLAAHLAPAVGGEEAFRQVLGGGEEHELLATFPDEASVPAGWTVLGRVRDVADAGGEQGPGVWLDGARLDPSGGGWDHFGG